jgi:ABC-type transport system involved in multi-copper enzyme maturation permease subunit
MTPLLKLELRRQRPMVVKMAVLTAIVCGLFYVAGKRAPADLLAAVVGSGLGAVLIVPMGISRDKMEGTLDFVCGLPVEPRTIAASRFVAMAVIAVPWASAIGAVSWALPPTVPLNAAAVAALSWLAMLVLGACGVALMACFELESLLGAPMIALVLAIVLVPRVLRALFPAVTRETLSGLAQQPAAPVAVAAALMLLLGAVGAVAFAAATRGFARYRTDPARR